MLILSRVAGESIVVGEGPSRVLVTVLGVDKGRARLGFEADEHVEIRRAELPPRNPHLHSSREQEQE